MATAFEEYIELSGSGYSENNAGGISRYVNSDVLHRNLREKIFFLMQGMMGPDMGGEDPLDKPMVYYPILDKTDLGKKRGQHVEFPQLKRLTGNYTHGTNTLKDTTGEQAFAFAIAKVYVETMRTATGWIGDISEVRNPFLTQENARDQLTSWLAEQEEEAVFDAFYSKYAQHCIDGLSAISATTHPNFFYGGNATSEENVDSGDTFDAALLEKMATYADVQKWNKVRVPDGVGGMEEGFIMLIHPFQAFDLRQDSVWTQAQREANVRDWKNPIFSGALGVYSGIFLYTSTRVAVAASGVTDRNNKRRAIFFGAHAIARATAIPERIVQRKEDDYENIKGWAIVKTFGYARLDWVDDTSGASTQNQSSAIVTTYAAQPY